LYSTSFYPTYSYYNLIAYDDDTGGSSQFQLTMYLQANVPYILVVTTFDEYTAGSYTIIASGLNRLSLVPSDEHSATTSGKYKIDTSIIFAHFSKQF
jgi:hypothetical protein